MMSFEQGSFDITTAMAGRLGPAVVSGHSAFLNIIGLTFVSLDAFVCVCVCTCLLLCVHHCAVHVHVYVLVCESADASRPLHVLS